MDDSVDHAERYGRAVQELIALLYSDTPVRYFQQRACEVARDALDADCTFLSSVTGAGTAIDASACKSPAPNFDPKAMLDAAVSSRRRVFNENGAASVAVPVPYGDTVLGAMSACDTRRSRFGEADADALEAIAQYVALARTNHDRIGKRVKLLRWERRAMWVIIAIAIAASLALALYGLFFARANAAQVAVNARAAADVTTDHLDRYFSSALQLAAIESAMAPQLRGNRPAVERFLETGLAATRPDVIYGAGLAFQPYAFSPHVRLFNPYVHRTPDGRIVLTYSWSSPVYDYVNRPWYRTGFQARAQPLMTQPYFDTDHVYMSAVKAIRSANGWIGVATVDVTSETIGTFLARISAPSRVHYIATTTGHVVAFPNPGQLLQFARSRHPARRILDVTTSDANAFIAQRYPGPRILVQTHAAGIPVSIINAYTPSVLGGVPAPVNLLLASAGTLWLIAIAAIFGVRHARSRELAALDFERERARLSAEINTRVNTERALRSAAGRDALTGLANRVTLLAAVSQSLAATRAGMPHDSLLIIDLNDFDRINDTFGFSAGDSMLVSFSMLLRGCAGESDLPARLGDDEFAVLVRGDRRAALALAERLQREMATALKIGDEQIYLDAGIGVAEVSAEYTRPENVIRDALFATYHAKRSETTTIVTFDPALRETASRQRDIQAALRGAVERDELLLEYQPIMHIQDRRIVGFEALMRWHRPKQELVGPSSFVPIAERTGLILALDRHVIERACLELAPLQQIRPGLHIAVNASALHFEHEGSLQELFSVLERTTVEPNTLKVELTESAVMGLTRDVAAPVRELHAMGIQLHLDDFGTGYSSLMYLQHLHVDALKIDKSFVEAMLQDERAMQIVQAIVALARNFRIKLIAEGVETDAQESALAELGVTYAQGYLYARPMPAQEAQLLL